MLNDVTIICHADKDGLAKSIVHISSPFIIWNDRLYARMIVPIIIKASNHLHSDFIVHQPANKSRDYEYKNNGTTNDSIKKDFKSIE